MNLHHSISDEEEEEEEEEERTEAAVAHRGGQAFILKVTGHVFIAFSHQPRVDLLVPVVVL